MWRSPAARSNTAGFTLIEALVALSIVTIALTSIGALVATSVRGTRSLEARLVRLQGARTLLTGLPGRDQLAPGRFSGQKGGRPWRLEVSPWKADAAAKGARWQPQQITVTVASPTGGTLAISTIRLKRRDRE